MKRKKENYAAEQIVLKKQKTYANHEHKENLLIELIESIRGSKVPEALKLIDLIYQKSIDFATEDGWTPLHFAAEKGLVEVCAHLLTKMEKSKIRNRVKIDKIDAGVNALHLAAANGHKEVLKLIIEALPSMLVEKANIWDYWEWGGRGPLHFAAANGHKEAFKLIIELQQRLYPFSHESDINDVKQFAVENCHQDIYDVIINMELANDRRMKTELNAPFVLANGIEIDESMMMRISPRTYQELESKNKDIKTTFTALEVLSLAINLSSPDSMQLLARIKNLIDIFGMLTERIVKLNNATGKGNSEEPISLVLQKAEIEMISLIYKLQRAAVNGNLEECKAVLPYLNQELINIPTKTNGTVLHLAALGENSEVCKLLIPYINPGAINITNKYGYTALYYAAKLRNKETCKLLIDNMPVSEVAKLLCQNECNLPIQKIVSKVVAEFIDQKFSHNEAIYAEISKFEVKLLKLYQVVDQLPEHCLHKAYSSKNLNFIKAKNYIAIHFFQLIGVVFKSVNNDSPISNLTSNDDCMVSLQNNLSPFSLWTEHTPNIMDMIEKTHTFNSEAPGLGAFFDFD